MNKKTVCNGLHHVMPFCKKSNWQKKSFLSLIIVSLVSLSSCENNKPLKETTENVEVETRAMEIEPTQEDNKIELDSIVEKREKPLQKESSSSSDTTVGVKELPVEKDYYESERDNPDYIGTPCEMLNGKCYRHNHK